MVYFEKITQPEGPEAEVGTLAHGALEVQGTYLKNGQEPKSLKTCLEEFVVSQTRFFNADSIKKAGDVIDLYSTREYKRNKVVDNEMLFDMFLPNGVPVTGRIDRIEEWDDGTIEVIDYKTNNVPFTDEDIETNMQLAIYTMVARQTFPGRKITATFDFLKHGRRSVTFTVHDLENFLISLHSEYDRMCNEKEFAPIVGDQCRFCHVKDRCPIVSIDVKKKSMRDRHPRKPSKSSSLRKLLWQPQKLG